MTTNKYIVLTDSEAIVSKRFPVVQSGYSPVKDKRQTITETIEGGLDVSEGFIYEQPKYTIRVREQEEDANYGTTHDLEYFYMLNNPTPTSGSPSDLITLTDHYGNVKHGYMIGRLVPEPVTTIIEGLYAWFLYQIEMRILPE